MFFSEIGSYNLLIALMEEHDPISINDYSHNLLNKSQVDYLWYSNLSDQESVYINLLISFHFIILSILNLD